MKYWMLAVLLSWLPSAAQNTYLIRNVTVIPMDRERVLPGYSVLVENGRIKRVAKSNQVTAPPAATIIDGAGKYLMPGLFDMHTHFFYEQGEHKNTCDKELGVMLANGLTTVRIMAGHPAYLEAKRNVQSGTWPGPDVFVASPQLAGQWPWPADFKNFELVDTPEKAVRAVRQFKGEGYDAIKITFKVTRPVYDAIIQTAAAEKIPVTGHVGPFVGLPRALEARQQIEHLDQFIEALLPDTSLNHGQSVSDFNIYSPAAWATVPHLDAARIKTLVKQVRKADIYVTPTNYFFLSTFGQPGAEATIQQKPDLAYIPADLLEEKWTYRKKYLEKMAPEASRQKYVQLRKQMVFALWWGGVKLMAGSDSPEFFLAAGFSLHDELAAMVAAGLSPYAALQTATLHPATYLGIGHQTGTIEAGKAADLILLDQNPLENITNTRTIRSVFTNGKWFDRTALDRLLAEARQ